MKYRLPAPDCAREMLHRGGFSAASLLRARSNRHSGGRGRKVFPDFQARVSLRWSSSIATGECDAPVAGNFYRSQVDADGRIFNFATVVVNSDKGQSALPAWSQACSLVGTNAPTLAVAFVSKHNPSSAAALEELGRSFSEVLTAQGGSAPAKIAAPFIGCVADLWNVAAPAATSPGGGGAEKKLGAPSVSSSSGYKAAGVDVAGDGDVRALAVKQDHEGGLTLRAASAFPDEDTVEDFKALVGDCARWTRENPGVVPDNEDLVAFDKELKASSATDVLAGNAKVPEEVGKSEEQALQCKKMEKDPESKNGELALEKEEEKSGGASLNTKSSGPGNTSAVPDVERIVVSEAVAEGGPGGVPRGASSGATSQASPMSDESVATIDDGYRMILCVAYLPGTKATAFHTTTTGLPNLPDMEAAIVRNNPHMILLGAPGYPYPEFVQRLSVMFPESCRAGAFLAPLYTSPKVPRPKIINSLRPLFAGTGHLTAGVVGLSLSSDDDQRKLPIDAFTEFLRMTLGMARISGHNFFDNAISNSLFFPKNAAAERHTSPRSAPVDPGSLLKRLHTYLLRHSKVQTQAGGARASGSSEQDNALKVTNGSNCCTTTSVEVKSSYEVPATATPAPAPYESHCSDSSVKMPLALLDTVLFPGWSMPLHMHEPRYRHLVRHCVEEGKPFGLTSYWHWQTAQELVGTMANLKVYLFEKDCRSYVVAHGVQRFRLPFDKMWVQPGSFGLNIGQVEFFDDIECEHTEELLDLAKQVVDRCRQLLPEADTVPGLLGSISDPIKASFAVGQLLPVPVRVKRRWLGMADTKFRLLEQMTFLNS
ncbi:uncharacterized protein LOC112341049 isoform X1 [Selaginella moellendorffii]|uniref:uncharacterized protein LOC112341049 isoform X1 n=2 Tax=Selaginella moellendorffii TaxID=88036 RepID=UPI000D1CABE6|nr:uncharacterized protein LOC112341049 isoform X1 [Selaginella moellendorffii]|eukprot:XP_024516221.1 uncharacterized protein LOC112341049 isoform X1 [Selaginella moellendorffii]